MLWGPAANNFLEMLSNLCEFKKDRIKYIHISFIGYDRLSKHLGKYVSLNPTAILPNQYIIIEFEYGNTQGAIIEPQF